MIDASTALICDPRMRAAIAGSPVFHGVTFHAIESEQACMEGRIPMAVCAGPGQPSKLARGVTALTSHPCMTAY